MSRKNICIFFVILTTLFNLLPIKAVSASHFEPAQIVAVNSTDKKFPTLEIVSLPNTEVLIYQNLTFVGMAEETGQTEDRTRFMYAPKKALSEGDHVFQALARDKTSMLLSVFSNEARIRVPEAPKPSPSGLPAPTLIEPNESTITAKVMPLIKGLTVNNTKVKIYIDGILNGATANLSHPSGTANFAYKPFLNLSVGRHTAWAVAVDSEGRTSAVSNILTFRIEEQLPAPVVKNISLSPDRKALVTGVVKNGLKVRVFVDHKLDAEMVVEEHPSGTANFAYRTSALSDGQHVFYATALDSRGKESRWSNIVYSTIGREPGISDEAAEEDVDVLALENDDFQRLKELLVLARLFGEQKEVDLDAADIVALKDVLERKEDYGLSAEAVAALEALLREKEGEASKDGGENDENANRNGEVNPEIEEILNSNSGDTNEASGVINESKENQGKLKWNLIIFIFFLAAVIAWIFWVNRELIKERREQNEDGPKEE